MAVLGLVSVLRAACPGKTADWSGSGEFLPASPGRTTGGKGMRAKPHTSVGVLRREGGGRRAVALEVH
jgi:hypothetical protein